MNYTKGEWKQTLLGLGVCLGGDESKIIADCTNMESVKECQANAHLIASAPVMYEALKGMVSGSEIAPLRHDEPIRLWERAMPTEDAILLAFKALAKAEGKE